MHFLRNTFVLLTVFTLLITGVPLHSGLNFRPDTSASSLPEAETALSSYSLAGNLTVGTNSDLVFLNTQVTVVTDYPVHITVYGVLKLINSTVSGLMPASSLNIIVLKNGTAGAQSLILENSTICIPGSIVSRNATLFMENSTISTSGNITSAGNSFRIQLFSSTAMIQNSTVTGLYRTNGLKEYSAGYANYTGAWPVSNQGDIPLNMKTVLPGSAIINRVSVRLEFSGNNPGGRNALNFSVPGNLLHSYILNQTGSSLVTENTTFSFNTSQAGYNLSSFMSGFTVFFNDSYAAGSNSSIWRLNITMYSEDMVHILGVSYFDYTLSNSSLILANSMVGLNQQPLYSSINQPNPEKNAVRLSGGSSLYFITSSISNDSGPSRPFIISGNSSIYAYQEILPEPESKGVTVTNYSFSAAPDISNSALKLRYSESVSELRDTLENFTLEETESLSHYIATETLLTQAIMSGSKNYSALNYNITIDGRESGFSPGPFPRYSQSAMNALIQVNLPEVSTSILPLVIFGNSTNSVTFSVNSSLSSSGSVFWNLSYISEYSNEISNGTITNVAAGSSLNISSVFEAGYLHREAEASVTLSLYCPNYTISGRFINTSIQVKQYSSAFPALNTSYRWLPCGTLSLNLTIINSGNQTLKDSEVVTRLFNSGTLEKRETLTLNVESFHSLTYNLNFSDLSYNTSRIVSILIPSDRYMLVPNLTLTSTLNVSPDRQFAVSIHEYGLAHGTPWSIEFSGKRYTSNETSIFLNLVNGTYSITVLPVPGYTVSVMHIVLSVLGKSESSAVSFSIHMYSVTINETGLPSGTEWTATLNGTTYTFHSDHGNILLPNGTYLLSLSTVGKYVPLSLNITVQGHNATMNVNFNRINSSFLHSLSRTVFYYRYLLTGLSAIFLVFLYSRFRDSVKICSKCFTTYRGFGKCPVCEAKELKNESGTRK